MIVSRLNFTASYSILRVKSIHLFIHLQWIVMKVDPAESDIVTGKSDIITVTITNMNFIKLMAPCKSLIEM